MSNKVCLDSTMTERTSRDGDTSGEGQHGENYFKLLVHAQADRAEDIVYICGHVMYFTRRKAIACPISWKTRTSIQMT